MAKNDIIFFSTRCTTLMYANNNLNIQFVINTSDKLENNYFLFKIIN